MGIRITCLGFAVGLAAICGAHAADGVPAPRDVLGHEVGADRRLADWDQVLSYMRAVDAASDRVSIEQAGTSTLDREIPIVVITSEQNQRDLDLHRSIARRLARPEGLSEIEAERLIREGKTIVLITCSIHATEVGSTQMALEFVYEAATSEDPSWRRWLDDVIVLLMPSINPDGQALVIDWYRKYVGTPYEGGRMPWLYHHYVGHDNNRDFYMLTQKESQVVNDVLYHRWFPQVFLDEHQMGSTGPRMFVPPQTDPVAPEVNSMVLRFADLLGTLMGLRLEEAGRTGVGRDMIYDSYWPGGTRNTAWWKNVVGLLTEVASARIATPIRVEPGELRGGMKGLPQHVRRANYLSPWEGGWWRLRDIIDYELIATRALLEGCSRYREDLLRNMYRLAREEIRRGRTEAPYAFVIPRDQHDPVAAALMVDLLLRHAVQVDRADAEFSFRSTAGARTVIPEGSWVVRTAQPYRPFILTMLQPQRYPEVLDAVDGRIYPPYDVTSWSLPVAMGVDVLRVDAFFDPVAARLIAIDAVEWPGGDVEAAAGGWILPHRADSVFIAMNRLLARGVPVHWLEHGEQAEVPGDVWIPPGSIAPKDLTEISRSAHVPVRGLETVPRARALRVAPTRVGLYKPWDASMDEGWTRWLLERYEFPYQSLTNRQITTGSFSRSTDVLLLPDVSKSILAEGKPENARSFTPLPPEYAGGLGADGAREIRKWVFEQGGVVVAMDSSTEYLIDVLDLPVRNVLAGLGRDRFHSPGSMLRLHVDTTHPLAYGMRPEEAGYVAGSTAFETRLPDARFDRRGVATYPEHADRILVSGYIEGADRLVKRNAVVDLKAGKGRVILIGFRPQHRAQPHRTFKMLFNALYLHGLQEVVLP